MNGVRLNSSARSSQGDARLALCPVTVGDPVKPFDLTPFCECGFPLLKSDDGCPRCNGFELSGRDLVGRAAA